MRDEVRLVPDENSDKEPEDVVEVDGTEEQEDDLSEVSLVRKEHHFVLRLPPTETFPDGETKDCVLVEMLGEEKTNYQRLELGQIKFNKDGKPSGFNIDRDLEIDLICRCLFVKRDDKRVRVEFKMVQYWPSSAIDRIARKCRLINGIGREADEKARKDAKKNSTKTR
jgi:hypothetical protein